MNITLVSRETTWGGGEVLLIALARELIQQGHKISIRAPESSEVAFRARDLCSVRPKRTELIIANDFRSLWKSALSTPAARKVFICHGWWQTSKLRNRISAAVGAQVFAVSEAVAAAARNAGGLRSSPTVLPLGPDYTRFRVAQSEEKRSARSMILGSRSDTLVLSWVGRFQDAKRPLLFVDLVERLGAKGIMVVPADAKSRSEERVRDELVARAARADITILPGGEPLQAYWASDMFVSTSLFESLGVALMEALATGLPVVTTAEGGPSDFLPDVCRLPQGGTVGDMAERCMVALGSKEAMASARRDMTTMRSMAAVARLLVRG